MGGERGREEVGEEFYLYPENKSRQKHDPDESISFDSANEIFFSPSSFKTKKEELSDPLSRTPLSRGDEYDEF